MTELTAGFFEVPAGHVAAIVTHLEMRARPEMRPERGADKLTLAHEKNPTIDWYRALYRHVGASDWLWFSRLVIPDDVLAATLSDPAVEVHALMHAGQARGLLELDFRESGACELAFFGVASDLIGRGAGRFLMNRAIDIAWARDITRFHVHTCTLDHPAALTFYMRSGFVPVRRQIEIAPDPRLSGILPPDAAPQVPVIG